MAITPTGHHILVKPQKLEDVDTAYKKASVMGIIIPEDATKKKQVGVSTGVVVAMGSTAYKEYTDGTPWCKVGDLVAYVRHGGMFIDDPENDEIFLLLNDGDIAAILTGSKE
jgi:co-chaperonin GroES (HSP10)